jgi:dipeptidyl aminopeptidase/acylaminoacyl peptidase
MRVWQQLAAILVSQFMALSLAQAQDAAAKHSAGPTPPEAFFNHAAVMEAKLSPSGKRLAFKTSLGSGRVSVAVLDIEGGQKLYRPARFPFADVWEYEWVGDDHLVFSSIDLNNVGEDRLAPGLFSATFDGTKARQLVQLDGNVVSDGKSQALAYTHRLLFVPTPQAGVQPGMVLVGDYRFQDGLVESVTPLWLNVQTGGWIAADVGEGAPQSVRRWWFDSAGNARVAYAETKGRGSYHWRGPGDRGWRQIAEGDAQKMPFAISSVDDAGQLVVTSNLGRGGTAVLSRFDLKRGAPDPQPLVAVPGFDFRGHMVRDKPGAASLGVRVHADAEATVWFDPAMQALQQEMDARLPGRVNRIDCRRCGQADMVALVYSYSDRDPGVYFLYQAQDKKLQFLLKARDGIDPRTQASVDFQVIKARDGRDLPVWITRPAQMKAGAALPAVMLVHGGPWVRGGYWRWQADSQFLASQGWLVIEPDFRGSAGYGVEHERAGYKQYGQAMQDDVADALIWAQKQGLAQPGKACIAGASYGGYAALMGPVRDPQMYRCAVAWVALADLDLFLKGSFWTRDDISGESRKASLPSMVGDVRADAAMLAANNPVLLASKMKAPVMLAYGEDDLRIPIEHGKRMRDALIKAGNPPEWITYSSEAHGFFNPENQIDFAKRMAAFMRKHLQ